MVNGTSNMTQMSVAVFPIVASHSPGVKIFPKIHACEKRVFEGLVVTY